ncbi:hypothetical protein Tco_0937827 [Tanacetum coccineum]|uniref:Uncharacterized protein n=1 Tax=Tanacetum coccineum TaxID=301880 RepID=A0ABQ5DG31_9ASTR
MKKSSLFAASITTATIVTDSNISIQTSHQDDGESSKRNSSSEKKNCGDGFWMDGRDGDPCGCAQWLEFLWWTIGDDGADDSEKRKQPSAHE